jgi:hypothetical protein
MNFTAAPIARAAGVKGVKRYNDTKTVQLLLNEHYLAIRIYRRRRSDCRP